MTKKFFKKKWFMLFISLVLVSNFVFLSCISTKQNSEAYSATNTNLSYHSSTYSNSSSSYFDSIDSIKLLNGIPLYVKKNESSRKSTLSIIVKGGTAYLTKELSGLENALFSMMTYGSKNYSYEEIQSLIYEMNFSLSPNVSREGAIFSMSCIDYYFEKVFPIFADAFLNPAFGEEQYKSLLTSYKQNLQRLQTDPEQMLGYEMTQSIFKNHPYDVSATVKPYSIENISIENMKKLHEQILDARRIMIVAVGNFDKKSLAKKLNKVFGTMQAQDYELKNHEVPALNISGGPRVITSKAASGTGYLQKVMSGPSIFDDDMLAANLSSTMYSNVLFNVVRENYGACYTPSASVTAMRVGLASIYIHKVSDLENVVQYEKEAHRIFKSGYVIDGKNKDGTYILSPISERLEGYKNQYINSFYGSSITNSSVASRISYSLLVFGEPFAYDKKIMQIEKITSEEVLSAFKKYWNEDGGKWFAIVGEEDKNKIRF